MAPVKKRALELSLPVLQPLKIKDPAFFESLRSAEPEVIVVAAYGKILPREILALPALGCLNVHASLLPRLRGACPIHRAILEGEERTGVTIMQMDEGLDTGDMLLWEETPIGPRENTGQLHDRLATMGATLVVQTLDRLRDGPLSRVPQDHAKATYAPKLAEGIALIDWSLPVSRLDRLVRGLSPFPAAYTVLEKRRLKILEAEPCDGTAGSSPGTVIEAAPSRDLLVVACGEGALRLSRVQPEGRRPMTARDFLAGNRIQIGQTLGSTGKPCGTRPSLEVQTVRGPEGLR